MTLIYGFSGPSFYNFQDPLDSTSSTCSPVKDHAITSRSLALPSDCRPHRPRSLLAGCQPAGRDPGTQGTGWQDPRRHWLPPWLPWNDETVWKLEGEMGEQADALSTEEEFQGLLWRRFTKTKQLTATVEPWPAWTIIFIAATLPFLHCYFAGATSFLGSLP